MKSVGMAQTVLGMVNPVDLGATLIHEHLAADHDCYFIEPEEATERAYVDALIAFDNCGLLVARWQNNHDQLRLLDEESARSEVRNLMTVGGGAIVDVTSRGTGRDPLALKRISLASGVHVIMGAGYYVRKSHPPDMNKRTEEQVNKILVSNPAELLAFKVAA